MLKTCPCCRQQKSLADFGANRTKKDGKQAYCRLCLRKHADAWAAENRDKRQAIAKRSYYKHREKCIEKAKNWARNNKAKVCARVNAREAAKLLATPPWAEEFFISEAYELAKLRTKTLGFAWQVDHIVPLRSKLVCGLHTEFNLRVIPATENMRKGNRHWPDMPGTLNQEN